jgi:hypothetical protein
VSPTRAKKLVIQNTNFLITSINLLQKFVIAPSRVKKPNFSYTFAFEKRTQYELPFGHDKKTLFALTWSGLAPPRLQHKKQVGKDASCGR